MIFFKYNKNKEMEIFNGESFRKNKASAVINLYGKELAIEMEGDKEKWFAAPLFGNPADRNRVIMHELVHYFQPVELPRDIKEAIPVILNDHQNFQMYSFDRGHGMEEEQKWRKIIWEIYQKGGVFKDVLALVKNH